MDALAQGRRPLCRACLDWSERRMHLGGALGAALFGRMQALGWVRRANGSRVVMVTPSGQSGLRGLSQNLAPHRSVLRHAAGGQTTTAFTGLSMTRST
jgi:hypothetical protein